MRAFHESLDRIYTDLTCINPQSAYHKKSYVFCCLLEHFESSLTNSVDPDQEQSDMGPHCLRHYLCETINRHFRK